MAKQTFTTGQVLTAAQMTSLQQTAMLGGAASAKVASYVLVAADAGDAITMSNAGATTITVNTGLFAAGDIVTIINLGAGVCTITAGTATVSTSGSLALAQNQGGVLRFTSASAAIFFQFATPASGDIEGVTAGTGISGGGTSGTVTITNSMATEIAAKGDLIVGTGSATFDNLTAGANDTVLTADSSTATGLKWATPSAGSTNVAGKNIVLNSNFTIWQRGTSISIPAATTQFTADRFVIEARTSQACTVSRQTTSDTTNLAFIQYCARVQRNSGQTGIGTMYFTSSFETVNSIPLVGKVVTLSFYARKGADFSSATSTLVSSVSSGTGTDQNISIVYTGNTDQTQNNTLTTTWQRFTQTVTIATSKTEVALSFNYTPTGTASTNDYYEITGIQLEIGSSATAYSPNAATYAAELAACQRYFQLLGGDVSNEYFGIGAALSTSDSNCVIPTKVTMRVTPTTTFTTASNYRVLSGVTSVNCTNTQGDVLTKNTLAIQFNVASGLTLGQATRMLSNNTSATISISAEL